MVCWGSWALQVGFAGGTADKALTEIDILMYNSTIVAGLRAELRCICVSAVGIPHLLTLSEFKVQRV